jgi:DNA-directed RNA polymerase alpha subunit
MSKKSPAKVKMLAAEAKRNALALREERKKLTEITASANTDEIERYASLDNNWRELGLASLARRALIDDGLYEISDLRKVSLAALKDLDGMGANEVRILVNEMKKADLSFRR